MRIGAFGGTFDPPHNGHLALARACLEQLSLDEVLFLPANRNPLKSYRSSASAAARVEMLRLLTVGEPQMAVSDIDITRGGPSYAVDSLSELQMAQPAEYWFLMGMDSLKQLTDWKNPFRLVKLCRIGAVSRPPHRDAEVLARLPIEIQPHIDFVHMAPSAVSSTEIRDRVYEKREISTMTPPAIAEYIRRHKMYEKA